MDLSRAAVSGAALACTLLAGCGGGEQAAQPFEPRAHDLAWQEAAEDVSGKTAFRFEVTQIRYDGVGWHVRASITNETGVPFAIEAPASLPPGSDRRWTWMGISTSPSPAPVRGTPKILHAETYDPPLPARLDSGESWSGTFSGPASPQPGTYLRVTFGMFRALEPFEPRELALFGWVTDHALKL